MKSTPLASQAVTTLLALLHEASPVVVRAACSAVARIGSEDAVGRLRELCEDAQPSTRAAAIRALGAFGDPLQLGFFQHVLHHDTAPEVVRAAECAVTNLLTATNWRPFFDEWSNNPDPVRRVAACTLAERYVLPQVKKKDVGVQSIYAVRGRLSSFEASNRCGVASAPAASTTRFAVSVERSPVTRSTHSTPETRDPSRTSRTHTVFGRSVIPHRVRFGMIAVAMSFFASAAHA